MKPMKRKCCGNCGWDGKLIMIKGKLLFDALCPKCGCSRTLTKAMEATWKSENRESFSDIVKAFFHGK